MDDLGLSADELLAVCRACAPIRVPDRVPWYLHDFITARLEREHPALARRLRLFDAACMERLWQYVKDRQDAAPGDTDPPTA